MSVYEQLKQGMMILTQHENEFKGMLLAEIIFLVENLQPCTYNATPEVADSLHLSLDQLKDLIARIQDDSVINAVAVKGIEQQVHDLATKNDLRRPKPPSFFSRFTSPTVATPATPVASVLPVASVPNVQVRPDRSWMGPLRRMFSPSEKGVPEAYQAEVQTIERPDKLPIYRIGGRKTRRKV